MAWRQHARKRATALLGVLSVGAIVAVTSSGLGSFLPLSEANQSVSSSAGFAMTSVVITGDPGGTAITETVTDLGPGDYRERLVEFSIPNRFDVDVTYAVSADLITDTSPGGTGFGAIYDARNSIDANNVGVTASNMTDQSGPVGHGGLLVELYRCDAPNAWVSTPGMLPGSTADREYTCQDPGLQPIGPKGNGIAVTETDVMRNAWRQLETGGTAAYEITCGVRGAGTLWCWGFNGSGSTGLATQTGNALFPTQVGTDADWDRVVTGTDHTCAIKQSGTLWCWGLNSEGRTGLGTTAGIALTPTQVGVATDWRDVSVADGGHTCAIKRTGTLWCWGRNSSSQLGDGTTNAALSPIQVGTASTWMTIGAGLNHNCGTQTDGTLWCWGANTSYATGRGINTGTTTTPTLVDVATDWTTVDSGSDYSCAIKIDQSLWCWGSNSAYKLGTNDFTDRAVPTRIGLANDWSQISLGVNATCGIKSQGELWCWGSNNFAQTALGPVGNTQIPTRVGTGSQWTTVTKSESRYGCALQVNGSRWCWGRNNTGGLGDGTCCGGYNSGPYEVPADGPASMFSPSRVARPAGTSSTQLLIRVRLVDDGTTNGRQNAMSGETVTLTHRFVANAIAGAV